MCAEANSMRGAEVVLREILGLPLSAEDVRVCHLLIKHKVCVTHSSVGTPFV